MTLVFFTACGGDDSTERDDESSDQGVFCCTVAMICDTCSECTDSETEIGASGNEDACQVVADELLGYNRVCIYPQPGTGDPAFWTYEIAKDVLAECSK